VTQNTSPLPQRLFRIAIILALSTSVAAAVIGTIHWPIVGDSPLLHYTTFLLDHGKQPYTQIIEMDLPGTYAIEWTARHTLGNGPLAWRIADFLLIAICWLSMIAITRIQFRDYLPGFFAGALFALIHFRDGPTHTGQRDLMMTAMLLPAVAFLFQALSTTKTGAPDPDSRTRVSIAPTLSWLTAGIFLGCAATVKPSGIFFAVTLTVIAIYHLHRNNQRILIPFTLLADGFAIPLLLTALWLHHHHALRAFLTTMRGLAAYHASLGRPSLAALIIGSFPNVLLAVAIPALPLFLTTKPWRTTQGQLILAGILLGCASYILQGKGYPYHRYPTEAFLFLLIATIAFPLLTAPNWQRYFAILTIALGAFFLGPISAHIANHFDWRNQEFNHQLAADLTTLSNNNLNTLQNQIQCFDNTAGCINTLYNLQLVQATGYLYDCYSFQSKQSPYQDRYRADFLTAIAQANPRLLVVTDQDCFTLTRTFTRLDRWPQFTAYVAQNYTLTKQYTPPHTIAWWRHPAQPFSYRIYERNAAAN
jgi:hypothetical protein